MRRSSPASGRPPRTAACPAAGLPASGASTCRARRWPAASRCSCSGWTHRRARRAPARPSRCSWTARASPAPRSPAGARRWRLPSPAATSCAAAAPAASSCSRRRGLMRRAATPAASSSRASRSIAAASPGRPRSAGRPRWRSPSASPPPRSAPRRRSPSPRAWRPGAPPPCGSSACPSHRCGPGSPSPRGLLSLSATFLRGENKAS